MSDQEDQAADTAGELQYQRACERHEEFMTRWMFETLPAPRLLTVPKEVKRRALKILQIQQRPSIIFQPVCLKTR